MRQYFQNVVIITFMILLSIMSLQSNGRELRPAEHGLTNQDFSSTPTTNDDVPEMLSFFGGGGRRNAQPPVALPIAKNLTWIGGDRGGMPVHHSSKDNVRGALLISSLVCGATGIVLLAVSAFVYVFRFRKEKQVQTQGETSLSTSADNVVVVHK
uniref:Transmembrane protein n=2 Tax=Nicotiana TaxID=4085 RepID=A0A1S3X7X7_TOBAC|nr:uncharacterized protein LOC104085598 [Nicotiana tomentosiformis]XP_016435986.1 PREDICTED: uncharacterized protein LOC107762168 [Nicotiana tabacum]